MTVDEKKQIIQMRQAGMSYQIIAEILGKKVNTVKTFCSRNGLTTSANLEKDMVFPGVYRKFCKQCGGPFLQYPGHREKLFCCAECRNKWWNTHISQIKRDAMYEYTCPVCGKKFSAYKNRKRKYCSHQCYITDRFGSSSCE